MAQMPDHELYLKNKQKVLNGTRQIVHDYNFMRIEPLLTRGQEYHLFRQYNYLKYKVINSVKPKPEYLVRIREIRDIVVCANSKLVVSVLKQQKYKDFENSLSDGYYGLIDAVDLFDFRKEFKFATYAYWAIQSKIRYFSQLELKECKHTTQDELLEFYPGRDETDIVVNNEERLILEEKLKHVSDRERKVIISYYGLCNEQRLGLREIGQKFKISKERVRQIRLEGLKKILGRGFNEKERLSLCS
jgi:RNA polymerase sigma factor (sigma-70 family)